MWQRRVSRLGLGMVLVCVTLFLHWKVHRGMMYPGGTSQQSLLYQQSIGSHHDNHHVSTIHSFFQNPELSTILSVDSVCAFGPGQGIEEDAGYKVLVEKVQWIHKDPPPPVKLFCAIYSYSSRRQQTLVQWMTWGQDCDGWTVFSNESWTLGGSIDLSHPGPESYSNMWQKVRSAWIYLYDHFFDDYDYFYLGGDDVYVLVANLKALLGSIPPSEGSTPRHIGQWLPSKSMIAGGPGYLLNRVSLQRLVIDGLPHCFVNTTASFEDRLVSQCLARLGIHGSQTDTRDEEGEQRFHDASPAMLYSFRAGVGKSYLAEMAATWERLPHPRFGASKVTVGRKVGLAAVAKFSVSFHNLYNPHYLARVHAILNGNICPADSPLGKGLRQHQDQRRQ